MGFIKHSLFCGKKIEVPNIFHKSVHTEDENFYLLIKIQRKYTFGVIFRNYWKKNYYFYYAVQKKRSALLNSCAHLCVCVKHFCMCCYRWSNLCFCFLFCFFLVSHQLLPYQHFTPITLKLRTVILTCQGGRAEMWRNYMTRGGYLCTKNDIHYSHCKYNV